MFICWFVYPYLIITSPVTISSFVKDEKVTSPLKFRQNFRILKNNLKETIKTSLLMLIVGILMVLGNIFFPFIGFYFAMVLAKKTAEYNSMITENFDYKEFANNFTAKLPALIPDDMNIEKKDLDRIKDIVLEIIEHASNVIAHDEDLNINLNQTTFFVQSIAEWTFYKTLDLINAQIPQNLWIRIRHEITFIMFKSLKNGINNDILEYKIKEEVETAVEKKWNEILDEIFVEGVLSEEASKNYDFDRMSEEIENRLFDAEEAIEYVANANLSFRSEEYGNAIESYLKAEEVGYEDKVYLSQQISECYNALNDDENAILYLNKMIELSPDEGYIQKGLYHQENNQYEEGVVCFLKAIELTGDKYDNFIYYQRRSI